MCIRDRNAAGERATDEAVGRRHADLAAPGFDHGAGDVDWLHIVHFPTPCYGGRRDRCAVQPGWPQLNLRCKAARSVPARKILIYFCLLYTSDAADDLT